MSWFMWVHNFLLNVSIWDMNANRQGKVRLTQKWLFGLKILRAKGSQKTAPTAQHILPNQNQLPIAVSTPPTMVEVQKLHCTYWYISFILYFIYIPWNTAFYKLKIKKNYCLPLPTCTSIYKLSVYTWKGTLFQISLFVTPNAEFFPKTNPSSSWFIKIK